MGVRHTRSHLTTTLPARYVQNSTGLGYATTTHTAQGISADTTHGLLIGQESRQLLYTMLTRGRHANHLYLQTVGDGNVHTVVRPETITPRTPTETLQQILARDDAPTSASSQLRDLSDPAARLYDAVQRYTDSLQVALEQLVPPDVVHQLDDQADQIVPGLTTERSWPTLRAHLLKMTTETGEHPLQRLNTAARWGSVDASTDKAALLEWRLIDPRPPEPGPLPWVPGPPQATRDHPTWSAYLAARAQLITDLAEQVRTRASDDGSTPAWAEDNDNLPSALRGSIEIWRAAFGVDPNDPRPTGPAQLQHEAGEWKQRLDREISRANGDKVDVLGSKMSADSFSIGKGRDQQHRPRYGPNEGPSAPSR